MLHLAEMACLWKVLKHGEQCWVDGPQCPGQAASVGGDGLAPSSCVGMAGGRVVRALFQWGRHGVSFKAAYQLQCTPAGPHRWWLYRPRIIRGAV